MTFPTLNYLAEFANGDVPWSPVLLQPSWWNSGTLDKKFLALLFHPLAPPFPAYLLWDTFDSLPNMYHVIEETILCSLLIWSNLKNCLSRLWSLDIFLTHCYIGSLFSYLRSSRRKYVLQTCKLQQPDVLPLAVSRLCYHGRILG